MKAIVRVCCSILLGLTTNEMLRAQENNQLNFHGYLRTTLGTSDGGDGQVAFQAPGALAKYRLGNEADTYMELGWDFTKGTSDQSITTFFTLAAWAPIGQSPDISLDMIPEFYIKFNRYLADADLWVGRRFYQRKDIHMLDYFWLNPAQGAHVGSGLENIKVGNALFDAAVFNFEDPDVQSLNNPATTGTLYARLLDLRLRNIALLPKHNLNTWFGYMARPQQENLGFAAKTGFGLATWLDSQMGNSNNTLALLHRKGAVMVQNPVNAKPIRENLGNGYDLSKASMFEINDNYQLNTQAYALQATAILHKENSGVDGIDGDTISWTSIGARPLYYINNTQRAALEIGYDSVNNERSSLKGSLLKTTLAFEIAKEKGYYVRPVIRAFLTHASWSSDFKGAIGGSTYADDTNGWSAGIQTEAWW